ncbi:hypothetical protein LTR10_011229 [Elasticomyces elasticus]|nr:hypothetical protein LTR10_011229 [Elasticomyces elasticus]KAK4966351.1 hypothetical protein LTR42_011514 [Elasticomyces elasticus]
MSELIKPFTLAIPENEVDRLHNKLRDIRRPSQDVVPNAGKDYGFETQWAENLYNYWTNKFSWRKAEEHINSIPQYTTLIEGLSIHFAHQRSQNPNAIPILLVHGWPGSFYEFSEIIPLLSNPDDIKDQAFHCIAPSLPGFCFSSASTRKGCTMKDTARIFHTLMLRLGYNQYCVQAATGVNSLLASWEPTPPTPEHDNPVGLLAFVGEKYEEAANPEIQVHQKWIDHILTTVCLYYFSNCIMTSTLPYFENIRHDEFAEYAMQEENLIQCPFAYTSCWFDTAPNSKRAVERTGELAFYKERDDTGHFACLENPEGIADDVREVVCAHWTRS